MNANRLSPRLSFLVQLLALAGMWALILATCVALGWFS